MIDIVGGSALQQAVRILPYRGHIFHTDKRCGARGLLRLMWDLRRPRYELVVDLRTDGLAYLLRPAAPDEMGSATSAGSPCLERLFATVGRCS